MKKIISLLICLVTMSSGAVCAAPGEDAESAEKNIILQIGNPSMNVNGAEKAIDGGAGTVPVVKNGRTLVPVRAIVEEMGGTVDWDAANNTAVLSYSGKTIKLVINSNIAYLNDIAETLDVAPVVMNGRTMLPIRFIAESFEFDVDWREATQQIVITEKGANDDNKNASVNYDLLSCIGKTKEEITKQYGNIVNSEYWMGGKYYIYDNLKSQIFYEKSVGSYDYEKHDDVDNSDKCLHMYVSLSELLDTPDKTEYTIEELQQVFGDYEFTDDLENDFDPLCYYKFTLGNYEINIESDHKNPSVEYVYVFESDTSDENPYAGKYLEYIFEETDVTNYTYKRTFWCKDGEEIVWEHETQTVMGTELEMISDLYEDEDFVYYVCGDVLNALDKYTGERIWTAENVGASNAIVYDKEKIYISGYYGPDLVVISKNDGRELYRLEDEEIAWVYDLQLQGKEIVLYHDSPEEGGVMRIDISNL